MHTDALAAGDEGLPRTARTPVEQERSSAGTGHAALLLLADGRFPSGGHAHSAGVEAAAALEGVHDTATLEEFLTGRLATAGAVAAAFAAAACANFGTSGALGILDDEFAARTPSPALRRSSLRLGRQILRAGRNVWPGPGLDALVGAAGSGPHQPTAFGAVAAAADLGPDAAALVSAHEAVLTPATAAVRLLGLDPYAVHALIARLGDRITTVAGEASRYANADPAELPAHAGPLLDVSAERHATWEVRLFAS